MTFKNTGNHLLIDNCMGTVELAFKSY